MTTPATLQSLLSADSAGGLDPVRGETQSTAPTQVQRTRAANQKIADQVQRLIPLVREVKAGTLVNDIVKRKGGMPSFGKIFDAEGNLRSSDAAAFYRKLAKISASHLEVVQEFEQVIRQPAIPRGQTPEELEEFAREVQSLIPLVDEVKAGTPVHQISNRPGVTPSFGQIFDAECNLRSTGSNATAFHLRLDAIRASHPKVVADFERAARTAPSARKTSAPSAQTTLKDGLVRASTAFMKADSRMADIALQAGLTEQEMRPFLTESGPTDIGLHFLQGCDKSTLAAVLSNFETGRIRRAALERRDAQPSSESARPNSGGDRLRFGESFNAMQAQSRQSSVELPGSEWSDWGWDPNTPGQEVVGPALSAASAGPATTFGDLSAFEDLGVRPATPQGGDLRDDAHSGSSEFVSAFFPTNPYERLGQAGTFSVNQAGQSSHYAEMSGSALRGLGSFTSSGEPGFGHSGAPKYPSASGFKVPGQIRSAHETVEVDSAPSSPAATEAESVAQRLRSNPRLRDDDIYNYTRMIAQQWRNAPDAHRLNFADSLHIEMLINGDQTRQAIAQLHLLGNSPPIVFVPVHDRDGAHWTLLLVNRETNQAFHYDSMYRPDQLSRATTAPQFETATRVAQALGIEDPPIAMPIAKQDDGDSCGYHVLVGIEELTRRVVTRATRVNNREIEPSVGLDLDLSTIQPNRRRIVDVLTRAEPDDARIANILAEVEQYDAPPQAARVPPQRRGEQAQRRPSTQRPEVRGFDMNTPQEDTESALSPQRSSDSFFDRLSRLGTPRRYEESREFDLNTPQEDTEPAWSPQSQRSSDSFFDQLSSLGSAQRYEPRGFDLDTPATPDSGLPELGKLVGKVGEDWFHGHQRASKALVGLLEIHQMLPTQFVPQTEFRLHGVHYTARFQNGAVWLTPAK